MLDLGEDTAHAITRDTREGFNDSDFTHAVVPKVNIVVAGVECKSASALNVHARSKRMRTCVRTASQRTGETVEGVRRYCEVHHPDLIIMENVTGLGRVTSAPSSIGEPAGHTREIIGARRPRHQQPEENADTEVSADDEADSEDNLSAVVPCLIF